MRLRGQRIVAVQHRHEGIFAQRMTTVLRAVNCRRPDAEINLAALLRLDKRIVGLIVKFNAQTRKGLSQGLRSNGNSNN